MRGESLRKEKRLNPQMWLHNLGVGGGGGARQDLHWTLGAQNSCPLSPAASMSHWGEIAPTGSVGQGAGPEAAQDPQGFL